MVDFNKSCEIDKGLTLELSGVPVWYYRCSACGFLFTRDLDAFSIEDWRKHVYNDDYALVDPDHAGARAEANAPLVRTIAGQLGLTDCQLQAILIGRPRLLDYGSGNGTLTGLLADLPIDRAAWDPFQGGPDGTGGDRPEGQFDLVTAFEVLEHTTTPVETARDALGFVRPGGALLFSTLVCDELPVQKTDWPYLAPRNGHVSIHTTRSLDILFGALRFQVQHMAPNVHVAMAI